MAAVCVAAAALPWLLFLPFLPFLVAGGRRRRRRVCLHTCTWSAGATPTRMCLVVCVRAVRGCACVRVCGRVPRAFLACAMHPGHYCHGKEWHETNAPQSYGVHTLQELVEFLAWDRSKDITLAEGAANARLSKL